MNIRKLTLCSLVCLLSLFMLCPMVTFAASNDSTIYVDAVNGNDSNENVGTSAATAYKSLEAAVNAAKSGDTIQLGAGTYTLYNKGANVANKDLTFVGSGTGNTTWLVGPTTPDPKKFGTEYNSDYSFDVRSTDAKETVTFKNMTLQSGSVNYLGFAGTDNTVVENCVIDGKTFYWGNSSALFKNTVFNCPPGDYALWTYGTPLETFEGCTFNSSGKIINVYADFATDKNDVTINFKDCTVNNSSSNKPVLNINDSNKGEKKYYINISGDNSVTGVDPDSMTCSRLFGYSGKAANNSGRSVVTMEGTTVWSNGKRAVAHSHDISGGSYNNGVASGNKNQYTEGYKDDAFSEKFDEWVDSDNGSQYRLGRKVCDYCGYEEYIMEVRLNASKTLDGKTPSGSDFNFVLKDDRGNVVQEKKNAGGDITFDVLTLPTNENHVYTISEVKGNDNNIEYDATVYEVKIEAPGERSSEVVSITKDGKEYSEKPLFENKTKSSSPDDPGKTDDSNKQNNEDSPKTGDETNVVLYLTLFCLSISALAGTLYLRKRS